MHQSGGYGSTGYGYSWKRAEAEKNLLRTHTTAVSSRMVGGALEAACLPPAAHASLSLPQSSQCAARGPRALPPPLVPTAAAAENAHPIRHKISHTLHVGYADRAAHVIDVGVMYCRVHHHPQLYQLAQDGFRPARYFSIDRVFRNEAIDRTHLAEFHQVLGVAHATCCAVTSLQNGRAGDAPCAALRGF